MNVREPTQSSTGTTAHAEAIDSWQSGTQPTEIDLDCDFMQSADHVTHAPGEDTYRLQYDPAVDEPSLAVVATVAALTQQAPTDLGPLYDAVDPEALDAVVGSVEPSSTPHSVVSFSFHGFAVTVTSHGTIEVTPT